MSDTISRKAAYEVLTEYYHHKTELQHKALREALDRVPGKKIKEDGLMIFIVLNADGFMKLSLVSSVV